MYFLFLILVLVACFISIKYLVDIAWAHLK